MEAERIVELLTEHTNRIKVSEKRIEDLEESQKQITELVLSVKDLANGVQSVAEEQQRQGKQLEKLTEQPAENWRSIGRTALNTAVSVLISALVLAAVFAITKYI